MQMKAILALALLAFAAPAFAQEETAVPGVPGATSTIRKSSVIAIIIIIIIINV